MTHLVSFRSIMACGLEDMSTTTRERASSRGQYALPKRRISYSENSKKNKKRRGENVNDSFKNHERNKKL